MNRIKLFLALFTIAVFATGCALAPVQYVQAPTQVIKICDPVCRYVAVAPAETATATIVTTTANVVPTVVYVQPQPLVYANPVLEAVVGVILLREIFGHHHRRGW